MADTAAPTAQLVCVYRRRNERRLAALVEQAQALGWAVALWALDTVAPELASVTAGSGPGLKLSLTNRLIDPALPGYVVVADDDIAMGRHGLRRLMAACELAALDLAQPAHRLRSYATWRFTRARPMHRARETTFVEIGPLFVVGPRWRDRLLPLPEDMGMGWGLELLWRDLQTQGCRLGIIDAVTLRHLVRPQGDYSTDAEHVRLNGMVADRGLGSMLDAQQTIARWWLWQCRPPWTRT